ncbi:unnamed protein product [Pedinophyceae sp. YPF-701]|nr:unnamed protein product [Pedinophyceae sp. YPF-701]
MSRGHMPTVVTAKGSEEQGGNRMYAPSRMQSARDLPGQLTMKRRADLEGLVEKDLKTELAEKERKHFREKLLDKPMDFEEERLRDLELLQQGGGGGMKLIPRAVDADDIDSEDDSDEDDDDDDDEEAALMAELEKIKQERAEEAARKAAEEAAAEEANKRAKVGAGNPLLDVAGAGAAGDATLKRKWYEDTVFRNQAKGEPKAQKRFINDTVRSDFHRKFLERYIK